MKEKIQIKSISGEVLFELEKENNTVKDTVLEAIEQDIDLSYADLYGANPISVADFMDANLSGAYGANTILFGKKL